MRLTRLLSGLFAWCVACGAPEEASDDWGGDELGALAQELTETFSGTLARNETAARGPLAVQPGSQLRVVLSGTGDADLYVRFGSAPTLSSYDCRPYEGDSTEQCVLTVPSSATNVFIDVRGFTASTYSLSIERDDGAGGGSGGSGGTSGSGGNGGNGGSGAGTPTVENFSGTLAQNQTVARGPFAVQPGSVLRVALSGTGDADLYVRFGSAPTLSNYDCRPYEGDSSEQCVLTVPSTATSAFVDVRGFTSSTYSLSIERVASGGGSGGAGGGGGSGGTGGSGSGGTGGGGGSGGTGGSGSGGSGGTIETFSGTLAQNQTVARGPFAVQPGSVLRVALSGTGDADLYVRFGSAPTLSNYDCRPYEGDSSEQCVLTVPSNATSAFVNVRGFTASTYSLSIERVPSGGGGSGGSGGGTGTEPFVIAMLGSSTAEGEGASSLATSWVGLLEAELSEVANVSIVNLARGGHTTLNVLPGSGSSGNIDAAIDESPDLIVVALAGSNDLEIGISTADYLSHLTQVRDTARAAGIPTFFVSTTPKNFGDQQRFLLADWAERMENAFDTCWVPANATYSPCYVDVFTALANDDLGMKPEYVADDNFHHNDAGHRVIFEGAVEVIEPYVCTVTECD